MEQLGFFLWLLGMASFNWLAIFVVLALGMAIFARGHERSFVLLLIPLIWLIPLSLAGLFVEADAKTAGWLGGVAWTSLAAFLISFPFAAARMSTPDWLGAAWMVANGVVVLTGAFVVGMAAGGTWL